VALIDDIARHAQSSDEGSCPAADDVLDLALEAVGQGREQVDPEGLGRRRPHRGDLGPHLLVAHRGCTHAAEAAGLGHGRDQAVVGHPAHPGEHHRMLDLQGVGEAGTEHGRDAGRPLTAGSSALRSPPNAHPAHPG
jgi:hypothetical protein